MNASTGSSDQGAAFRALHKQPGAFILPNPWDVGSARILAYSGFKALATTSAGLAFSSGVTEGGLTRDQVLDHCREIVGATNLPVNGDLENGYGHDPETVAETIRLASEAGLAGCSIEDYTGDPDKPIYDFGLTLERVNAAVEAARSLDTDFVFTARAENYLWGRKDLDDTLKRLQAYETAGADVVYAPGLADLDTIRTVCEALNTPFNLVMGLPGATFGIDELEAAGVKRISVGSALARLAYGKLVHATREMAESGTFSFSDDAMGFKELEKNFL